jgi:hypothetical protein
MYKACDVVRAVVCNVVRLRYVTGLYIVCTTGVMMVDEYILRVRAKGSGVVSAEVVPDVSHHHR